MTATDNTQASSTTVPADLLNLLDSFPDPKILLDRQYRIIAANAAYRREFDSGQPVEGLFCYALSHHYDKPCDQAGETCPLRGAMESGEPNRVLHVHHTSSGREHVEVEVVPVKDDAGAAIYYMETMHSLRRAREGNGDRILVGYSRPFNRMLELAKRVAARESSVLLLGESGTGKELVAQAIHDMSPRASAPFVALECSGLTETLFESEMFGYEKGAFTGAVGSKVGLVEAVRGGTLFLDEVGDIPMSLQVKLLRLMEAGTYRRIGGVEPLRADFRLVAATHRDLAAMVQDGTFRQDLYFRINVFPIQLPPLRERAEDIPMLVETLLSRLETGRRVTLSDEAMSLLMRHDFPGNVRELRNILERALIMLDGNVIQLQHLYLDTMKSAKQENPAAGSFDEIAPLENLEMRYLAWATEHFQGDRKTLAERLGISERTLYRKLRNFDSIPPEIK
ncbi:sigma-54 interaction domain-containing protein [Sideroxydans lithotrophicus]|uniref:PAS modulated sigma54 specific transcriptional regulator, Fis family n=1 Tax=Sideroxydans lithotrophicus (strain ES-1) TaxID=580332 RepID=D5CP99_SIDLE|nr:sigma-54-dependent Fis family transcriptional regulator [Sideroxydans lithotrophicus]ADE11040.1 PAS modulated sigma54 specific transcriptional regulator, Fis family [Sideroxydans lithotrophicus ES-1]